MHTTLIDTKTLSQLVEKGNVVVIDCRFSLADTSAGSMAYQDGHIPGAHYAHLDHDLSSPIVAGVSGRHPLPELVRFLASLRHWGVNNDTQVAVYDDAGGAIAARAWWLCRWTGHERCAVLDGGINAWLENKLPLSIESPTPLPGNASARAPLVSFVEVNDLPDNHTQIVDARAPERYSGEQEPLDKRAGHIPGALNLPFAGNLDAAGRFLSAAELNDRFAAVLDGTKSGSVVHYCGSGVTAAHNILAMQHAGLDSGKLYAGSWSEWVQDETRPIALGEGP